MRIAVAADELTGIADALVEELRRRGHEPVLHGAYADDAQCVDWQTIEWDDYWTFKGDRIAQSGSMSAHLDPNDKNRMIMVSSPISLLLADVGLTAAATES